MLVCLEGSPSSGDAVSLAIHMARAMGATLFGLAIVDEPGIKAGTPMGIGGSSYKQQRDTALLKDAELRADEWLERFGAECDAAGVKSTVSKRQGRPSAVILEESQNHDLSIVAREMNFRFETDELDRQTRGKVLHGARKPVMIVPQGVTRIQGAVLIAYDGSSASKRALNSFADSGLAAGRALHVMTVGDVGATAWEVANVAVQSLKDRGLPAELHNVVSILTIADAILGLRTKLGAGMIVMGAYAHSRIKELVWGSVTQELLEKSGVPLFLHH